MSADELLAALAALDVFVGVRHDGTPYLDGETARVTPELMAALKADRAAVILAVEGRPPRQWLMPSGFVFTEGRPLFDGAEEDPNSHLSRATHWRHEGEEEWRPTPKRKGVEP